MFTEGRKAYLLFASIKEGVGGFEEEKQEDGGKSASPNSNPNTITRAGSTVDSGSEVASRVTAEEVTSSLEFLSV